MATSTITLGKIKFNWKGDWSASIAYKTDDVVKYGPSVYVCLTPHTSQSTFALDLAKWDLMSSGLENAGTWNDSTLYKIGQTVTYGGAVYIALQESTNQNPYTAGAYWQKFVDGQQFEGDYDNSTDYQKGDIVYYGGYLYVAKQNTTGNLPTSTTNWDVYVKGYEFLEEYNGATQYKPGDVVKYGGNRYVVKEGQAPLGVVPTNTTYWQIILSGFDYKQIWSSVTEYRPGDVAVYGGRVYITVNTNQGTSPDINTGDWDLLVDGTRWRGDFDNGVPYLPGDLTKFGAKVYYCRNQVTASPVVEQPDRDSANWELYADGVRWQGAWLDSRGYTAGDIARLGGRIYVCIESYENDGSTTPEPPNSDYWQLLVDGFKWQGSYNAATEYEQGDVVEYAQSSYICVDNDVVGVTPGTDASKWNLVAQGDSNAVLTTRGDIIFRDATQTTRLGIGPAGSFLTSNGNEPVWGHLTPQNDYYVSPQGDDSNDGRTANTSWRTLKHACEQTFSLGQVRINVQAGQYNEQCPIRVGRSVVLEGNGLGAVTLSPDTTNDNGFGTGISDDGSTPNANSNLFLMNNGARLRNFVFRNFSTGSVIVSLDPGYGPDDTSVWITSQSPYVQNCTSFTPGGTGFKIDGALHNGGYKSMVANDWTQINSDGIGIHALNDGRTEIVSCFTYYCNIGYLAEGGAKIRAIVGNNSYGEYGAVARGFSQAETPLTGKLRLTNQTINSLTQLASNVHVFTSYRDSVGNRFFVGHTAPTANDVSSTYDNTASYPVIVKYNSAGSLDWVYTYESNFGAIHSVVELSDGIYAGGVLYDGSAKGFVMNISKAGEFQWQKTIGNTSEIVKVDTDGNNLYALGNHTTTGTSLTKLNPAGIEQWSRTLEYNDSSASNTLVPTSMAVAGTPTTSVDTYALAGDATAEENVYVAAYDTTVNQSIVTRINSAGGYVTTYQYGDVRINSLALDTGNGDGIYLMAAGWYDPAGGVNKNPIMFRLSVDGTVQWQIQHTLSSENGEWKDVLPFGNDVYACGYLNESTNNNNTGLLTRFTSNGTERFLQKIDNGTNNIVLNGVMLDGVNVIAAGNEQTNGIIVNLQRDDYSLGSVSSGAYTSTASAATSSSNTVVTTGYNEIDMANVVLGSTTTSLTLNQSPGLTATSIATRQGFAGIGTGTTFQVDELDRVVKEGSVLTIDGDTETYFVIGVNNFIEGDSTDDDTCTVVIQPAIPSNKTPDDQTTMTFREAFSQVRMSGHDFLDIGTGGFADTNYPVIIDADYTQPPDQTRETLAENGGRVFYVTTDQDGNFRVGDYFKVEQATGRATLSSEEFDLSGLNELQLGSITAGRQGATVNEFSTDGTFADNSDSAVPTEKATKTYVDNEIAQAIAGAGTIQVGTAPNVSKVEVTGSGVGTDTIEFDIAGTEVAEIGSQYLKLPAGDTASRPGTPVSGMFRYNTDSNSIEVYGSADWEPAGSIKWSIVSSDTNIDKANGYAVDTSGGPVTITLPASPQLGDQIRILDKKGTFATNNCVLDRNGNNIMSSATDLTISVNNSAIGLVYTDATDGWRLIEV